MESVKVEDNLIDEENYNTVEKVPKSYDDNQHSSILREHLNQVEPSINHNFQLPLSPQQISSIMMYQQGLARMSRELVLSPDTVRYDDDQSMPRNVDYARTVSELELNNLLHIQNAQEQEISKNPTDLTQNYVRWNELYLRDIPLELGPDLSHLTAQLLDVSMYIDPQYTDNSALEHHYAQRLDQSVDRSDQRLEAMGQRIDPQIHSPRKKNLTIKSERVDDGYYYDTGIQGLPVNNISGAVSQSELIQPSSLNLPPEQNYSYNDHLPITALNQTDLMARNPMLLIDSRHDPQNLVVHRQLHPVSPSVTVEVKKKDSDSGKKEPKENLKPTNHNKMYHNYNNYAVADRNQNNEYDSASSLVIDIKGEYYCIKCNEPFPSKRALKQHTKSCDNTINTESEKFGKFWCNRCPYKCQSSAILKIHERTHTGEKPYSCPQCDYKSGQKNNIAKHVLVHNKEKPYKCQYCDYKCAQKNNLVVHERTHTGYKPFACVYCDYRTVQKPNLVKHMYLHTNEKPFRCELCNYRCVQKTNLTKHKQKHLNERDSEKNDTANETKPYKPREKSIKCDQCPYRCVQKTSLEKHMQFKHPDQINVVSQEMYFGGLNLKKNEEVSEIIQNLSVKKS